MICWRYHDVLNSDQFQKINAVKDEIVIKNEKQINSSLQQLTKQGRLVTKLIKHSGQQVHNQRGFMAWQWYIKKIRLSDLFFRYLVAVKKN